MRRTLARFRARYAAPLILWLNALVWGILISMLCGCTRTVYVPTESKALQTDTVWRLRFKTDTLLVHDSVTVMLRGDTVVVEKYRDRYRVRELRDTVYRSMVDSVKVSVPYPVEVKLTAWQRARMNLGGVAMGVLVIALCAAVVWLARKRKLRI